MNLGMHIPQHDLLYKLETQMVNRLYKRSKEIISDELYKQLTNEDRNSLRVSLYNEVGHNLFNQTWDHLVYEYYKV